MRGRLRERGQYRRLGRRTVGPMSTDMSGGGGGGGGAHSDGGQRPGQVSFSSSAFDANQLSRPMEPEGRHKEGRKCATRHVDYQERVASLERGRRSIGSRMRPGISPSRSTRCLMAVLLVGTLATTNYCFCLQSDRLSSISIEKDGAVRGHHDELSSADSVRQTPVTSTTPTKTFDTTIDLKKQAQQTGSAISTLGGATGQPLEVMSASETNANQWPVSANNQSQMVVASRTFSAPLPSSPLASTINHASASSRVPRNGTDSSGIATGATTSSMTNPFVRSQQVAGRAQQQNLLAQTNALQSTQLMPRTMGRGDLMLTTAASGDALEPLVVSASKKKKKMMKKKKKMEKKHKEWKKGKKHKKKKYESKKKKGGSMKKKKGKKEKKKWGMEKKGHKKKGNFKKKKWGHKKKMKKGHKKGKKGHKMLKDKGHKKKGFKKVYHKEEWGKKKKWHDIKREKKWNTKQKKWKKKWHQEKGKKYKGKHMKKYHKKNKHGKKYKKEKKSKWKKHKGEKFKKGHKKKKEEYSKKKEGGKKKKMKKEMKKMKKKKG